MRLILVRHGQTPANVDGILESTVPGPGLTALGHEQAEALVEALADEKIDAIFVSSMIRTHLTAAPLVAARGLEPAVRDGLREIAAGDVEGNDRRSIGPPIRPHAARVVRRTTSTYACPAPRPATRSSPGSTRSSTRPRRSASTASCWSAMGR